MTAITFDTLKFVERLTTAGVPEAHAKAEAFALRDILTESLDTTLATKADVDRVERKLEHVENNLKADIAELKYDLLKWIVGLALAQFGLLVGVLMKLSH
ncbi:DUF1640 domain-containing protein [Gammaproteobacteria bacterium]